MIRKPKKSVGSNDHRVIPGPRGGHEQLAQAGNIENLLDKGGADHQIGELRTGNGQQGDQRVPQRMEKHRLVPVAPF